MDDLAIAALFEYYARLDAKAQAFRNGHSFGCPPGCGHCCSSTEPEITVLEAVPLARLVLSDARLLKEHTARTDAATRWPCLFYRADRDYRCGVYGLRPMICRMFGFAGGRDKTGAPRFAFCPLMNKEPSLTVAQLGTIPVFLDMQQELLSFAPLELARLMPFTDALDEAIRREGLRLRFTGPDDRDRPVAKSA